MPSLAVCVLFFEKLEQTRECIASFLPSGAPVHVLSNGSSPESLDALRAFCEPYTQVSIHVAPENLGPAAGRNCLWRATSADWLFFVDNDITIQPGEWKPIALRHIERHGDAADAFTPELFSLITGRIEPRAVYERDAKALRPSLPYDTPVTNIFPGGAVILRRSMLENLNGYDEDLFVLEDFELGIRAAHGGRPLRVFYIPEIRLVHEHLPARTEPDKYAASERYSIDRSARSREFLRQKYGYADAHPLPWSANKRAFFLQSGLDARADDLPHIAPDALTLHISAASGLRCRERRPKTWDGVEPADMPVKLVRMVLGRYPRIRSARLCGPGEATLNPALGDILHCLADAGIKTSLTTNGTNPAVLQGLPHLPDSVSIPLYGHDRESFFAHTGEDAFEAMLRSYNAVRDRGKRAGFVWTLRKHALDELARILELCDELKPDFLHIRNYLARDVASETERSRIVTLADTRIMEAVKTCIGDRPYVSSPLYPAVESSLHTCRSYLTAMTVDGDGNVGCCQGPLPPEASLGNLYRDADPFHAPPIQRLRMREARGCCPHAACLYCFKRTEHSGVYPPPEQDDVRLVRESGLFDEQWYRETYLLGRQEIMSPVEHFLQYGPRKGYRPNRDFDPQAYILRYPECLEGGTNPLLHCIKMNRKPHI